MYLVILLKNKIPLLIIEYTLEFIIYIFQYILSCLLTEFCIIFYGNISIFCN